MFFAKLDVVIDEEFQRVLDAIKAVVAVLVGHERSLAGHLDRAARNLFSHGVAEAELREPEETSDNVYYVY